MPDNATAPAVGALTYQVYDKRYGAFEAQVNFVVGPERLVVDVDGVAGAAPRVVFSISGAPCGFRLTHHDIAELTETVLDPQGAQGTPSWRDR